MKKSQKSKVVPFTKRDPAEGGKSPKSSREARRHVSIAYNDTRKSFLFHTIAEWSQIVTWLLPRVRPGVILAFSGPLGAGKTTCVQYLAKRLGIAKTPQSPTFALLRSYRLPKPLKGMSRLIHVDAYRIEDEKDLLPLELDVEMKDHKTLLVLEWPENIPQWLGRQSDVIWITIQFPLARRARRRGGPHLQSLGRRAL